ncbi:hypothetical protein KY345_00815 [Candidatus Woesearchaeota archaeon]|nr:hypothetical protein [Candidatus Woesearchaeota archaeon]
MRAVIIIAVLILVLVLIGCYGAEKEKMQEYQKCTSVCASVIGEEDYVTLHLCNEECKKEFLNSSG